MYIEVERKRMSQVGDIENNGYAGRGPQQQQDLLDKDTLRIQAETNFND